MQAPFTSAPNMEALRGKVDPKTGVLFLKSKKTPAATIEDHWPIGLTHAPSVSRNGGATKYTLGQFEPVWEWGMYAAQEVCDDSFLKFQRNPGGEDIVLAGFALALPETQATEVCLGEKCRECFLWEPCIQGVLPFGWLVNVRIKQYHYHKCFEHDGKFSPREGALVPRVVSWGVSRPREILSFNKDLYLPQTFKTDEEKAFHDENDDHHME